MKELIAYRNEKGLNKPQVNWKYVLFNWNDHSHTKKRVVDLARKAKVDNIFFTPTLNPIYAVSWRSLDWRSLKSLKLKWNTKPIDLSQREEHKE